MSPHRIVPARLLSLSPPGSCFFRSSRSKTCSATAYNTLTDRNRATPSSKKSAQEFAASFRARRDQAPATWNRPSDEVVDGGTGGALPVSLKLFADEARIIISVLSFQGLLEAEKRTRVPEIALEVRAENFLSSGVIADFQQHRAKRFAHGIKPIRR